MDNNNPSIQTPVVNTPQAPVPPQPVVPQVHVSDTPSGDSKKMILFLVAGIIAIALLVGGIYFFLNMQQAGKTNEQSTETAANKPVVKATPIPPVDTIDALDKDLNAVNVGTTDADFAPIDQDLQQL